ncbi:hypothetical protein MTO96_029854 [Rhipicephalus appendiculatus]
MREWLSDLRSKDTGYFVRCILLLLRNNSPREHRRKAATRCGRERSEIDSDRSSACASAFPAYEAKTPATLCAVYCCCSGTTARANTAERPRPGAAGKEVKSTRTDRVRARVPFRLAKQRYRLLCALYTAAAPEQQPARTPQKGRDPVRPGKK